MSATHPASYSGPCLPSSGPRLSRRLSRKEGRRTSAPAWLVAASRRAQERVVSVPLMSPVSCPAAGTEQLRSGSSNRRTGTSARESREPPPYQQRNVCIDPAFRRLSDTEQQNYYVSISTKQCNETFIWHIFCLNIDEKYMLPVQVRKFHISTKILLMSSSLCSHWIELLHGISLFNILIHLYPGSVVLDWIEQSE